MEGSFLLSTLSQSMILKTEQDKSVGPLPYVENQVGKMANLQKPFIISDIYPYSSQIGMIPPHSDILA